MATERTGNRRTTPVGSERGEIERRTRGAYDSRSSGMDRDWGVARALTLASGLAFLIIGLAGFIQTGFNDFAAHDTGERILGFEVNPLHNLVHLAFGVAALVLCTNRRNAIRFGAIMAVGYAAAFIYGVFALDKTWDFLSINAADNVLHLVLAVLGLVIATVGVAEDPARRISAERPGTPGAA